MGRINAKFALDNYSNDFSNNGFFGLENDGDTAVVRFLYSSSDPNNDDLDTFLVHEVEIDGKKRYVECTQKGDCPGCKEIGRPKIKTFIQLVDEDEDPDAVQTWERGQQFLPKILGLINKYGSLVSRPFEIERHGKKGDSNTTYEIYPLDKDGKTLDDFPEKQDFTQSDGNGFILQKSNDDFYAIIDGDYSSMKKAESTDNSKGSNRRGSERGSRREDTSERSSRRRGSSGSGGSEDASEGRRRSRTRNSEEPESHSEGRSSRRERTSRRRGNDEDDGVNERDASGIADNDKLPF